jgi:hypothetical protein
MTHPVPITLFDYICALARTGANFLAGADAPVPGGCDRCHTALTPRNAYFARFGRVRCPGCIGTDGFASIADLELFRHTGTLRCAGCGQLITPARIGPDGTSAYSCRPCGTTSHYTMPTVA